MAPGPTAWEALTRLSPTTSLPFSTTLRVLRQQLRIHVGVGSNDFGDLTKFQKILQKDYPDDLNLGLNVLGGVSLGNYGGAVAVDGSARAMGDCEGGPEFCADADYMIRYVVGAGFQAAGLPLDLADLNLGASISLLGGRRLSHTRTNLDAATYWGETVDQRAKGYALNLGARFKATDIVTVGLVAENVLSSLTWEGTRTEGIYTYAGDEPVGSPAETSLDTVRRSNLPRSTGPVSAVRPPAWERRWPLDIASDGSLRFGVEKSFLLNAGCASGPSFPRTKSPPPQGSASIWARTCGPGGGILGRL